MTYVFLYVCLICMVVGGVLIWYARNRQARTGLPSGSLTYVDTTEWKACQRPLFSNRYRLTGKPDYLIRRQNHIIPVEVKSSTGLTKPYDSHVFQLMAYCLLVEETEKKAPPYGLLHYPNADFRVEYTSQARAELLDILNRLRTDLSADDVSRSHTSPQRCRSCGYRHVCTQSL